MYMRVAFSQRYISMSKSNVAKYILDTLEHLFYASVSVLRMYVSPTMWDSACMFQIIYFLAIKKNIGCMESFNLIEGIKYNVYFRLNLWIIFSYNILKINLKCLFTKQGPIIGGKWICLVIQQIATHCCTTCIKFAKSIILNCCFKIIHDRYYVYY